MDISKSIQTSVSIFKAIMDNGQPITLYHTNRKTRIPMGTIHRHFKMLVQTGKIRIYNSKTKGRKKIEYGPTIYGMISFYRTDKEFAKKIENYFLIWIEQKEFQKELAEEGYDISYENLRRSKKIFKKYMDYFSAVEKQIEKIRKGEDAISHDIQILLGSMMLSSSHYYQKLWIELYKELPGMQKSLDEYMNTMINSYKEFKNNIRKSSADKIKQTMQNI